MSIHTFRARLPGVLAAVLLFLVSTGVSPAAADSPSAGGDVQVAQTLGERELTVVLRRLTAVPGPLHVDVITHAGVTPGALRLTASSGAATRPAAAPPPAGPSTGTVELTGTPGSFSTTLPVDRAGPWELAVSDGARTALIPFVAAPQVTSPPELAVYTGFTATGVFLLVSVVVAVRSRRGAWTFVPVAGMIAGLAVGITGALLSASLPLPPQAGTQVDPTERSAADPYALAQPLVSDYSRPPVALATTGPAPVAGRPADIGLALTDSASGLPVDDLVVHDSALVHLLLVGPGGQLWHLHPIRTGPGTLQVHVTLPQTGHYALSAELARRGGGVQLVRSAAGLDVTAGVSAPAPAAPLNLVAGRETAGSVDGTPVSLTADGARAGAPTTIVASLGTTADLQPWLGMLGHLVVAGPLPPGPDAGSAVQAAPLWGHAHSMGNMTPSMPGMTGMGTMQMTSMGGAMSGLAPVNGDSAVDETVAAYGPDISFTYTFARPGTYRAWIQAERNYRIVTVPISIEIATAEGAAP